MTPGHMINTHEQPPLPWINKRWRYALQMSKDIASNGLCGKPPTHLRI